MAEGISPEVKNGYQPILVPSSVTKIIVIGDKDVGKTSFVRAYYGDDLPERVSRSVAHTYSSEFDLNGNMQKIEIWDVPGGFEYQHVRRPCYIRADIALLCYAIDSPQSKDNVVSTWATELMNNQPTARTVLVGMKKDLRDDAETIESLALDGLHPVTYQEGLMASDTHLFHRFIECSARTGEAVFDVIKMGLLLLAEGVEL